MNVVCSKSDCDVAAVKDNLHFVLSSPGGSDPLSLVINSDWAESGGAISPSWGVGFTQAGQIR